MSAQAAAMVKERPPQAVRAPARDAQFNFAAIRQQFTSRVEPTELEARGYHGGLRHLTGLVLTVLTLCSTFVFLGRFLGNRSEYQRTRTLAPAATTPDLPAKVQVEPVTPSPHPSSSTVSLDIPGFVLQVGAMTHESNADALSETLQRNDFPAFVFKRSNDRFYKVAVGAFADADSAAVVKRKLEKRGFKAILRHWSPD